MITLKLIEALKHGLVSKVVPHEDLEAEVRFNFL